MPPIDTQYFYLVVSFASALGAIILQSTGLLVVTVMVLALGLIMNFTRKENKQEKKK